MIMLNIPKSSVFHFEDNYADTYRTPRAGVSEDGVGAGPIRMAGDDRIAELQALRTTRLIMQAAASLPKKTLRARLDCLVYFHTRVFPWKIRKRGPDGEVLNQRVEEGGVYEERRLGFPRSWKVAQAISKIHKTCPLESKAYEFAFRRFKEARRRFLATQTKESWEWYLRGKGNSQLFRSWMNLKYGGNGFSDDESRVGYFRYRYNELLPRTKERKRARRQITEALNAIENHRAAIFEKMGVPEMFRVLA
jgi:hypothetical protein